MKKDFQLQEYTLDNKLENNLFFKRMDIAVVPSYNFWFLPEAFIIRYGSLNKDFFSRVIRVIKKHHEPYDQYHTNGTKRKEYYNALSLMNYVLPIVWPVWEYIPQILRDLYTYYPKFNISFDEAEFLFLDGWLRVPYVIHLFFGSLIVADQAFLEEAWLDKLDATNIISIVREGHRRPIFYPPRKVSECSVQDLKLHILDFFIGDDPDKIFLKIISLYLENRPLIKEECIAALKEKGSVSPEESLVNYFLTEYIFKGICLEALQFLVANMNLSNKNPFFKVREQDSLTWIAMNEEEQAEILREAVWDFECSKKELELGRSLTGKDFKELAIALKKK